MARRFVSQRFIYKIRSGRLARAKWNLELPLEEARRNDEVIALADSQVLRWIDEINGIGDANDRAIQIKKEIQHIKRRENSSEGRKKIRALYKELDEVQFKPDYLSLVIDKNKDYYRACKGFTINGISYKRLVGTNGGIKNSTIVFVSERVHEELSKRIDNGRRMDDPLVTAKLEAYKALTCSASDPVSRPNGVLVVHDVYTTFKSDYIYLTDDVDGEPEMEYRTDAEVTNNATDGFGLILPSLARRWAKDLGLNYMPAGFNTRFSFEKGMAYTFDFIDFAESIAGKYIVKDAWGDEVDIRDVDLILTTSMVKLWKSYDSAEHYIETSYANGYEFGVPKYTPKELDSERTTNYQFIQSYDLSAKDIDVLTKPTIDDIKDVLSGDWRKTAVFLHGESLSAQSVVKLPDDFAKAILVHPGIIKDSYVQRTLQKLIKKRIDDAKIGVLNIHGNYSLLSGDPYLLCESVFGMEPKGLLRSGEIYNKYWLDVGSSPLACFRAPMTCHNNIRKVRVSTRDEARYWYQYMDTVTILNAWDTTPAAINGADFDGDIVMLTDNDVLVRNLEELPALFCVQKSAKKSVATEEDFIKSNIDSFGNDIGKTTNWITSMFEVRDNFEKGSAEYEELTYRIMCGQLYQQNAINNIGRPA